VSTAIGLAAAFLIAWDWLGRKAAVDNLKLVACSLGGGLIGFIVLLFWKSVCRAPFEMEQSLVGRYTQENAEKDAMIAAKQEAWDATKAELEEAKKSPARFEITGRELLSFGPYAQDILLRAEIELVTPVELAVERYSVELSLDGSKENPAVIDDVHKWKLPSDSLDSPSQPLVALPANLRSGHPVEGWIHFVTTRNQYEVRSGRMRLLAHSSRGSDYGDIPCSTEYWNVRRDKHPFFSPSDG
jgi:hypothetical protein